MDSSLVYLAQTDTTVGFLSSNSKQLSYIKQRDPNQKILQTVDSLQTLQTLQRVPNKFKKLVRRSKKTTFIYANKKAFRVVANGEHHQFLKKFHTLYSTSANITQQEFHLETALNKSDIVIYTNKEFCEKSASKIYKLSNQKLQKIR